jgi:hypothetical protein
LSPVAIAGRVLTPFDQKVVLGFVTFVAVSVTSLSSTLFWALGVSVVGVAVHAILHTTDAHEAEFDSDNVAHKA